MKLIGLTGAIASGKSTVAVLLKEKGALVIDADQIAREVVEPGKPAWQKVVDYFGEDILLPDRMINRLKLGDIVFRDPQKLAKLNSIVHPEVMDEVDRRIKNIEAESGDGKVVVVDIPLLLEVGYHRRCDITVVVAADRDIRMRRLIKKGLSKEEAESRIEAQHDKDKLQAEADIVIENNSSLEDLAKRVNDLWGRIIEN